MVKMAVTIYRLGLVKEERQGAGEKSCFSQFLSSFPLMKPSFPSTFHLSWLFFRFFCFVLTSGHRTLCSPSPPPIVPSLLFRLLKWYSVKWFFVCVCVIPLPCYVFLVGFPVDMVLLLPGGAHFFLSLPTVVIVAHAIWPDHARRDFLQKDTRNWAFRYMLWRVGCRLKICDGKEFNWKCLHLEMGTGPVTVVLQDVQHLSALGFPVMPVKWRRQNIFNSA